MEAPLRTNLPTGEIQNSPSKIATDVRSVVIPSRWQVGNGNGGQFCLRTLAPSKVTFSDHRRNKSERISGAATGCPAGNGKKLSNGQVCCLVQLCLAAA